jgi:hypothetical protein
VSTIVAIILLFFVVVPIGQAVAKAIEARASRPPSPESPEDAERLEQIDTQIRYLAERVEEISDRQEFLTRLLEDRPSGVLAAHSEEEER